MAGSYAKGKDDVYSFRTKNNQTFQIHGAQRENIAYIRKFADRFGGPAGTYNIGLDKQPEGSTYAGDVATGSGIMVKGQHVGIPGRVQVWQAPRQEAKKEESKRDDAPSSPPDTANYELAKNLADEYRRSTESESAGSAATSLFGNAASQAEGNGFDLYRNLEQRGRELTAGYGKFIRQQQLDHDVAMARAGLDSVRALQSLPKDLALSNLNSARMREEFDWYRQRLT